MSPEIERWFIKRGLPHAISEYSATQDVFTRAWPFLLAVLTIEMFTSFSSNYSGWAQAGVFIGGVAVVAAGFVVLNVVRHRPALQLPDAIGIGELAAFVVLPAVVAAMLGSRGWSGAVAVAGFNLVLVGLAYLVTAYGLVPALRVGLMQAIRQFRTVTQLVARGLPLLLLLTAFIFLNAEMWQVAHDFRPAYFAICVSVLFGLAMAFLFLRLPKEISHLAAFTSWDEICALATSTDAPLGDVPAALPVPDPDLQRVDRINLGILLTISQAVQVVLIGVTIGVFYVGFGLLAVRSETVLQWTTATEIDPIATLTLFGGQTVLTWEHLAVAGFISAFSMLQFAVASVTDSSYREEFYDEVAGDARAVLAVRALCLARSANSTETAITEE